ncbi:MAG: hypothetical protein HY760_03175 [Nitrospirae bacterium]|nr:hypothetical protein [Nitrospirota bacterium]
MTAPRKSPNGIGHTPSMTLRHFSGCTMTIISLFVLLAAGLQNAHAQALKPPDPPPIPAESAAGIGETDPPRSPSSINPCASADVAGKTWLDQTHDFVAENLCGPAVWFDGFFGEDRVLEDVRPGTFVKLRNAARWTEGAPAEYVGDFSIWWRLPHLEKLLKKARIFIVSGSEADKFTTQPGRPFPPGFDPETGTSEPT